MYNRLKQLQDIRKLGSSGAAFDKLYNENPSFKQFADQVRNMTPEQAFKQYGLDFDMFKGFKW